MEETKQLQEVWGYPFLSALSLVISLNLCTYTRPCFLFLRVCPQKLSLTPHKRVAELEKVHNSVAEELQKRYTCPGCGTNNMGGMEEEAARTSSN